MIDILEGDALERLRELADESVQCCVTSPPYWGLRCYGVEGQYGLESTPEEYVGKMVEVFREVRRVLRKDGTLWLNLGSSMWGGKGENGSSKARATAEERGYVQSGGTVQMSKRPSDGNHPLFKPKDLVPIPWMVAMALQADGWWLRSDIIWAKPNPMPESVTDRPTKSHEYLFLLTKSATYFYDAEAIKEKLETPPHAPGNRTALGEVMRKDFGTDRMNAIWGENGTRNKRSVWNVATAPYPEAHFATYPPDLIKPCIMAGTSAKGCCSKCGAPWERIVEGEQTGDQRWSKNGGLHRADAPGAILSPSSVFRTGSHNVNKTLGWQPTCHGDQCRMDRRWVDPIPCTVLDPFAGSGTTGAVALELGRRAILIELNPKYVELIEQRCDVTLGLQLA